MDQPPQVDLDAARRNWAPIEQQIRYAFEFQIERIEISRETRVAGVQLLSEQVPAAFEELERLRVQVQRIRNLADRVEAKSDVVGGYGEWFAKALREELDKE
jgi:hypothetical protein